MEENKKYKAIDIDVDGPFDGWIIEELDQDEYKEAVQKEEETKKVAPAGKLSSEELEKKRQEQLAKIKALIDKKKNIQNSTQAKTNTQTSQQTQPVQQEVTNKNTTNNNDAQEKLLEQKSKETGIPVEVLRMIEEKKKEIRAKKEQDKNTQSGDSSSTESGNKKGKKDGDAPQGVEIADTVAERRRMEEDKRFFEERQVRKVVKKKPPVGEEIGDRRDVVVEPESHDLYNVFDDVGLDTQDMDDNR